MAEMEPRKITIVWFFLLMFLNLATSAPRTLTIRQVPSQSLALPPGTHELSSQTVVAQHVSDESRPIGPPAGPHAQAQFSQNLTSVNSPQEPIINSFSNQLPPNPPIFQQQQPSLQTIAQQPHSSDLQIPQHQQLPAQQSLPQQPPPLSIGKQSSPFIPSQASTEPPTTSTNQALPATPKIVPPPVDKNVDLNGDGALSLTEVQYAAFVHHGLSSSVVENLFNQVDHNTDRFLTSIEFNDIRPLVLAKAENAAQRYLQNVDTDKNGLLSLSEAQTYILREYGISNRDVERIWRLVVPSSSDEMDAVLFSKLRRRIRGMSIRLARQIMKSSDKNEDGHIDLKEAQMIAFEQEGIGAGDVVEMLASVDDNNDNELNAPEFADFERIVRSRSIETSSKALKVVDTDGSGTLTMDEAKNIAFDHYGFDEHTLEPFFAQADENEDGALNAVEFAGFRSVIRARAVKNAASILSEVDVDNDGVISNLEAEDKARREDDMEPKETFNLFSVADQDKSGALDKVELADFLRLVRLSAIKYANDHFREFDLNHDKKVTVEELQKIIEDKYQVDPEVTREFFVKVDVDTSSDLSPGEIVDFRHEIRKYVAEKSVKAEIDAQNKKGIDEVEEKLIREAEEREKEREQQRDEQVEEKTEVPRRHPVNSKPNIQKDNEWRPLKTEDTKGDNEKHITNSKEESYEEEGNVDAKNSNKNKDKESPKKISHEDQQDEEEALLRNDRENVESPKKEIQQEETLVRKESEQADKETTLTPEDENSEIKNPIESRETTLLPISTTETTTIKTIKRRKGKKSKIETTMKLETVTPETTTETSTIMETTTTTVYQEDKSELIEDQEDEDPTPSTTTTTEKPKKKRRRLRKKTTTPPPTTTTITHPNEYEDGEYESEENEQANEQSDEITKRIK